MEESREDEGSVTVREVELSGGPPWGLRLGAATTARLTGDEEIEVVGAVKIARVSDEV